MLSLRNLAINADAEQVIAATDEDPSILEGRAGGKRNPARPRPVVVGNGLPAALPPPNRRLFDGLFPAPGVPDTIRGIASDRNSCQLAESIGRCGSA